MQDPLKLVSLNVLHEPKIAADSPYHFTRRWPAIQEEIRGSDVVLLQEVHEGFLPAIGAFAGANGYVLADGAYHTVRKTHLGSQTRARARARARAELCSPKTGAFQPKKVRPSPAGRTARFQP